MKEEDLIIGPEGEGEGEEIELESEFYEYDDVQMIVAACDALNTVESINVMTAAGQKRIDRIKRKALRLIEHHLGELYDLTFNKKEDDETSNENES